MSAVLEKRTPLTSGVRPCSSHRFVTYDGVELFYRHWPAAGAARGTIVMFHRGHEHGGRMVHLVDEMAMPDVEFFAWDARGHGHSPGQRGDSPSFGTSVRDVQTFMEHLGSHHEVRIEDVFVLAQSVGAVLVSAWVHDYAPRIRGMSLASPAFKVKLYVPFAREGLKLWMALWGNFFVNSYVKARFLTHDAERIASYESDPLIARAISARVLLGLYEAADRVVADAAAITVPTQVLVSGADWVVHQGPQKAFFERLSSTRKELVDLPGFFHDTLGEKDRHLAVSKVRAFADAVFVTARQEVDVRQADRRGHTFEEAQALSQALPWWTPRGLYWAMTRLGLKLGGKLSKGIALGHATGFDSGSTLDYVYRHKPHGAGPLGRLVDRIYLESIGWRGIRVRKAHVQELMGLAMRQVREQDMPLHVMDIAAGHGRYVLDAVAASRDWPDSILLRDYSDINVLAGKALITSRGVQDIARFEQGDAFDQASLAAVTPRPTLVSVSGLYELFPDNAMLERSLAGLAQAMPKGACLVYTGQPWHPQLEMIARALTSHRQGQAWVMRRRTQLEMDQLVAAAGFTKVTQRVDEWGIFTVSLAVRQ
jgi:alpha-beta hydrolase superfamily lysophospholipase